ncbi:MAG TPA: hypothetical protein DCG57_15640 [Candidatus Riflebacteria bacterium]|nr:hypothetical protein [Candidatus Riflebacteria bacterium]
MNIENLLERHCWLTFLVLFIATMAFSFQLGSDTPSVRGGLFFVPQPEYVERVSGTFRSAVAQFIYMRGALELAGDTSKKVDMLLELFHLALRLDPRLVQAAFLGGMVTPNSEEDLKKAAVFLDKAVELNPNEWRILYWTGFTYLELDDISNGTDRYWKASLLPGAPPFLRFSAANLPTRGRTLEQSIIETEGMLESVDNDDAREWIMLRSLWLHNMLMLENKAKEFKNQVYRYPVELEELVERGLIKEIPKDDIGNGFYLMHPGDPEQGYMVRSL